MATKLPLDIHEAFYRVVHDYPEGVPTLAAKMGMPVKVLYNKADPDNDSYNKPTLADGVVATLATGDKRILHAFANTCGEACFTLPDLSSLTTDALMIELAQVQITNGSFHHEIHDALNEDNEIDRAEYARIKASGYRYLAAILEALARMGEMAGVKE